jgi:hypothetical protein
MIMPLSRAWLRGFVGKQARHPACREDSGESKAQRSAGALRYQHAALGQGSNNTSRLAILEPKKARDVAARQLAAIEDGFKDAARLLSQRPNPDFLLGPQKNAGTKTIRLHKGFHEAHLVKAGFKVEARELGKGLFAEVAAAIQIVAAP